MVVINRNVRDIEIKWTERQDDLDRRAPTASEMAASNRLAHEQMQNAAGVVRPAGVTVRPSFAAAASRGVTVANGLTFHAPGHPNLKSLGGAVTVNLPALADSVSTISRYDHLQLVIFGVEVTGTIDSDINLAFEWSDGNPGALQTVTKENTRRIRTAWMIVHSQTTQPDAATIYPALTAPATVGNPRTIAVSNSTSGVALLNNLRAYTLDPTLVNGTTYEVIEATVQVIPLCRVWRAQEHTQNGYIWGNGGEPTTFEADYHIQPTYKFSGDGWLDIQARTINTLERVAAGLPLLNSPTYDRAVENLINGQVGANADAPGAATASPNGSVAIANDQRITFTNQGKTQKYYCLPVTTVDSGGFAQASVPFQSSPSGAYFSPNADDHKVFNVNGLDITGDGTLTGLGKTGALVWTANSAAIATPGDTLYVQAGIYYPPGSGFQFAGEIEAVYRNVTEINAANVREGADGEDISAYAAPANGENYIVVVGRERAALHYIYRKFTVTTDSNGVLVIPNTARGVFAFINGVSGRIDSPVRTGLTALTAYDCLIYEPPRVGESWQFQKKSARYAGIGNSLLVDGAQIASLPVGFGSTQGGGNSVFLGSAELQYEPIGFRLPENTLIGAVQSYEAENRVIFLGERENDAKSYREIPLTPAAGYSFPRPGQLLSKADASSAQTKGLAIELSADGKVLGIAKNPIQFSFRYQLVVAFAVLKNGIYYLAIAVFNEGSVTTATSIAFDTDSPHYMSFDLFHLY